jgi:mannose-6-phosphate isomerase-like protein (cupin superfamily)
MKMTFFLWLVSAGLMSGALAADSLPYAVENDRKIAKVEPGPHGGTGQSTGSIFFQKTSNLPFSFRKRVLHPGSSIGVGVQDKDEVHYVVSGTGTMTIDGNTFDVGPGDAVLTRPGHKYGLVQTGSEDLVLIITYEIKKAGSQR